MSRQQTKDKTKAKERIIKRISLLILLTALVGYFLLNDTGRTTEGFLPLSSNQLITTDILVREQESGTEVHAYGRGFFHITKDGVSCISSTGQTLWSEVLNASAPLYRAEADILVFNSRGRMYSKTLENPILSFSINKNGYLSVITQDREFYRIEVFGSTGEWKSGASFFERNVYPIATDISDDNRYMAISLLNVGGVKMSSEVVIAHLERSAALDVVDGIFASSGVQDDTLIGTVEFMEGNNLVFASDKRISCAIIENDGNGRYSHKWDLELTNQLDKIRFNEGRSISIALGEPLINREAVDVGTVYQYNLSKELLSSTKADGKVTYLFSGMDATIIGTGRLFRAVNRNGGTIWSYNATRDVRQIVFFENTSKVLLVSNRDTSVMRAQRSRPESIVIEEDGINHGIELIGDDERQGNHIYGDDVWYGDDENIFTSEPDAAEEQSDEMQSNEEQGDEEQSGEMQSDESVPDSVEALDSETE